MIIKNFRGTHDRNRRLNLSRNTCCLNIFILTFIMTNVLNSEMSQSCVGRGTHYKDVELLKNLSFEMLY